MNGLLKIAKHIHMKHHHAQHHDHSEEVFNAAVSGGEHMVKRHKAKKDRKK